MAVIGGVLYTLNETASRRRTPTRIPSRYAFLYVHSHVGPYLGGSQVPEPAKNLLTK